MQSAKPTSTPLANHFKLTKEYSPKTGHEQKYIEKVSYALPVGSLMYVMVYTKQDIAHAMGVVSR